MLNFLKFILLEYVWFTGLFISAVQQSDSVIHIYIYIYIFVPFHILFPDDLSQDTECSSLCCRTLLFIHPIYKLASANPKLPIQPSPNLLPLDKHKSVLYVCESVSLL